jgi:hypothetical protein
MKTKEKEIIQKTHVDSLEPHPMNDKDLFSVGSSKNSIIDYDFKIESNNNKNVAKKTITHPNEEYEYYDESDGETQKQNHQPKQKISDLFINKKENELDGSFQR